MRVLKLAGFLLILSAIPLIAQDQPPSGALGDVLAKVVARENQEMEIIRRRSPLVETYIQKVRKDQNNEGWQPDGDRYFIGRADLPKGLDLEPLQVRDENSLHHVLASLNHLFSFGTEFLPEGFLQMIYVDSNGLDMRDYHFEYVRREFLGEVRTLVFDVTPSKKSSRGRFLGRIWVEDQAFTIVRFNGTYLGNNSDNKDSSSEFHFDSWRINCGPNLWLPAFIYSEENTAGYPLLKAASFKAQTRLWGYNIGHAREEQELSKVLIESSTPVIDQSQRNSDPTPLQQKRAWDAQAQNNMVEKLQTMGLIAPKGEVDKILDTVVNNLEVTNNLSFDPEIQCRILMTSTIESFTIGNTIVLSRGLIDVLPDEASLAAMIAKEIGVVMLGHKVDTRFAFYDRLLRFDEKTTFQHFDFVRNQKEDAQASEKSAELLKNSPYKDQLGAAEMFIAELRERSRQIPNLISPRFGDAGLLKLPAEAKSDDQASAKHIVALPIGGRIKLDPWSDTLNLLKAKPMDSGAQREKMPFEITPFVIYLTRVAGENPKSS